MDDISASNPDKKGGLYLVELSLDSLAFLRMASKTFLALTKTLNVLTLHAAATSEVSEKTVDSFETVFAANCLGHHLLLRLLKPVLLVYSRHDATPASYSFSLRCTTPPKFGVTISISKRATIR